MKNTVKLACIATVACSLFPVLSGCNKKPEASGGNYYSGPMVPKDQAGNGEGAVQTPPPVPGQTGAGVTPPAPPSRGKSSRLSAGE